VERKDTSSKTAKAREAITQLNEWKNLRELKNVQLGVSYSVIIMYAKCIKMQNMAQAIGYKNQS